MSENLENIKKLFHKEYSAHNLASSFKEEKKYSKISMSYPDSSFKSVLGVDLVLKTFFKILFVFSISIK